MGWLEDLKKATGNVGKAIGAIGGSAGGLVVGAVEAGINKIDGMDNDAIMKQWEKTMDAGIEVGGDIGEGLGEIVPEIAATIVVGKIAHDATQKGNKPKTGTAKKFYPGGENGEYEGIDTSPPMGGGSGGSSNTKKKEDDGWDNTKGW